MPPKTESAQSIHDSNMLDYGTKIYEQVFVKRRMPKGNKIKLTQSKLAKLKKWLTTTNTL